MTPSPQPFLVLALFIFLAAACHKDGPVEPTPKTPSIRFGAMEVGQKSRYLGLLGAEYYSSLDSFFYTQDTLQLEIIGHDDNGYLVEETYRYAAPVSPLLEYEKDSIFRYYFQVVNNTLQVKQVGSTYIHSRIFGYLGGMQGLPLSDISSPKLEIGGWKTSLNYCECHQIGYAEAYRLFGQLYPRLNILVENSPMALDGNGETYIYSKSNGIVRFSTYSWWTQTGYGWDLLP